MMKISLNSYLKLIFATVFFVSCTSIKDSSNDSSTAYPNVIASNFYRYEANCIMNSSMGSQSLSFRAKVNISSKDTISMVVYGPLGITVGKLYSDSKSFRFLNVLENTVYIGTPSQENIKKATNISISLPDLIHLFKGQTPYNIKEYRAFPTHDNSKLMFQRIAPDEYADFAVIDKIKRQMVQYQRKDKSNSLLLNSTFDAYKSKDNYSVPTSINISIPSYDGKVSIEIEDFKFNDNAKIPETFNIPSSATLIDLDK